MTVLKTTSRLIGRQNVSWEFFSTHNYFLGNLILITIIKLYDSCKNRTFAVPPLSLEKKLSNEDVYNDADDVGTRSNPLKTL